MNPPVSIATSALAPAQLTQVRSILVIQFRYLGDMVLLSSLFRNLHIHLPQAKLAALADDAYTDILRNVPDLHEIVPYPRQQLRRGTLPGRAGAWLNLIQRLRAQRFDMVIDVANTSTSRTMVSLLGARWKVGYRPYEHKKQKTPYNIIARRFELDTPHFIDHYLEPLHALGLDVVERDPVLRPLPDDGHVVADLLQGHGLTPGRFLAVHAGARVARKCWPAQNFAQVISELGLATVLVGTPNETPIRDAILQDATAPVTDLIGKLSVGQLVALLGHARLFIGNDSGPMHIAAATGVPVVSLFGPSEARFWAPIGAAHTVLERTCRCGLDMKQPTACDVEGAACLKQISVDEVVAAAWRTVAATEGGV